MAEIRYPEWRAELATSKYPFADTASLTNAAGDFLPEDAFADASLYIIGAQSRVYISRVVITSAECELTFNDSTRTVVAVASFSLLTVPDVVRVLDVYGRPAGALIAGAGLAIFRAWTVGTHVFEMAQSEFAAAVTVPTPEVGVRGFVLDDGSLLAGDAWLIGENGVVLSYATAIVEDPCGETTTYPVIRVDVVGDPLYRRTLCDPVELFTTPRFLRQLRLRRGCEDIDLVPDEHGDIKLTVGSHQASDTVLRVRTTPNGLRIETVGPSIKE